MYLYTKNKGTIIIIFIMLIITIYLISYPTIKKNSLGEYIENIPFEKRIEMDIFKGSEDGILIEEYFDFNCRHCFTAHNNLKPFIEKNKDKIKFVVKHFTLSERSLLPHSASECVLDITQDTEKYFKYSDLLFENQGYLDKKNLLLLSGQIGIEQNKLESCLYSEKKLKVLEYYKKEGIEKGVTGTPAFFVNGNKSENIFKFLNDLK